ncbi:MAG: RNA polymerase sigma factor [Nannocystaceae bacterium]|nr:RNA polymerase sigma factor [bacterium]
MTDSDEHLHSQTVGSNPRRRRDPAAQWVIDAYREHFRYTWALVGRLGVPSSHIEDVVQEIFIVLHRRRHDFRNESSVKTWLHGIALRVARRHRGRIQRGELDPLPPDARSKAPSIEARVAGRAQLARLDALLDQLPDAQREVFVLAEVAQLRAPEIAQVMGIKLNTVYSRLRLARGRMKASLEAMRSADTEAHGAA